MLTSSNQYLRPEYLTPLPTTLDSKNSPLALLAQTCSAIGADSPNPKLLANIEKSTKSHKSSTDSRDKSSPNSNQSSLSTGSNDNLHLQMQQQQQQQQQQQHQIKSSFKPYESAINMHERSNHTPSDERSSSNLGANNNSNSIRIKTPKSSSAQLLNGHQQQRCDSNQSATSQTRDTSPALIINGGTPSRRTPSNQHHSSDSRSPHNQSLNMQQQRASSKDSGNISLSHDSPNSNRIPNELSKETLSSASSAGSSLSSSQQQSLSKSSLGPTSSISSGSPYFQPGYPPGLGSYPMDLMTASALMSPHHPMFKAAALSPYFNYARLKGANDPSGGGGMMPPVCRDPYCTGCPMSPHVMNKATGQPCPAGCTQCDSSSASKSYQSHNNAAAAYAHAQLAALAAASQLPYVCSWIAGDSAYCGKRFGTSDELFQHLRTHTASMSESMLNAVAATGLPPNHPLFQRTYPTPPLSPLSSARYHPYGKPSMLPPSLGPPSLAGLSAGMPPHPSLAQYFSPYSLYGPRLGQSPSMHP